MNDNTIAAAWL